MFDEDLLKISLRLADLRQDVLGIEGGRPTSTTTRLRERLVEIGYELSTVSLGYVKSTLSQAEWAKLSNDLKERLEGRSEFSESNKAALCIGLSHKLEEVAAEISRLRLTGDESSAAGPK